MATLPTSINDFSTVVADNYPASGDAVGPNLDDLLRLQGASIADLRDGLREAYVTIEDKRFGGAGDDSTNNITPLTDAMAAGAVVQFGTGTYRFTVDAGQAIGVTVANITRLVGQGKGRTTLKFVLSGTTVTSLLQVSTGRLELDGLTIEVVNPDGAQVIFFNGAGLSGFRANRCKFDGGVTHSGATVTYTAYGINFGTTGTHEDIQFVDCECLRFHWFTQKTNTATSTQSRMKFIRCDFSYFYRTPLSFNSPSGITSDVSVEGCSFRLHQGADASLTNCFFVAASGVSNLRISDNHFDGVVEQAIHLEEGPHGCTVVGNTFDVDGIGIAALDNNIGGSDDWPEDFVISANVIRKQGTLEEAGSYGIWLIDDASAFTPGKRGHISNNVIYGFQYGISDDTAHEDGVSIRGNDAHNCTYGFRSSESYRVWDGNRSISCGTGVLTNAQGGVFRNHGFTNCTATASDGGRGLVLINPYFEIATASVTAGSTNVYALFPLSSTTRASVTVNSASTTSTQSDTDFSVDTVLWDGTTATITNTVSISGGGTSLTTVSSGGNLAAQLFSTSARTNVRVVAHLNGAVRIA